MNLRPDSPVFALHKTLFANGTGQIMISLCMAANIFSKNELNTHWNSSFMLNLCLLLSFTINNIESPSIRLPWCYITSANSWHVCVRVCSCLNDRGNCCALTNVNTVNFIGFTYTNTWTEKERERKGKKQQQWWHNVLIFSVKMRWRW